MDFAKKQLEKYGWEQGKGLGKEENGIQNAIKPVPKHGLSGIGHKISDEFTDHWWHQIYNNAAKTIEVNTKQNGDIININVKNNPENKSKTRNKRIKKQKNTYSNFVKGATLTNGIIEKSDNSSEIEDSIKLAKDDAIVMFTDDELYRICEGRTAHKGARHGLKCNGKLARIEQQEKIFNKLNKQKR